MESDLLWGVWKSQSWFQVCQVRAQAFLTKACGVVGRWQGPQVWAVQGEAWLLQPPALLGCGLGDVAHLETRLLRLQNGDKANLNGWLPCLAGRTQWQLLIPQPLPPSSSAAFVYMNFPITELGVIIGCAITKLKQVITMPN